MRKENHMMPQTKTMDQESAEETRLQEQYIRQVEDHSRPAQEVLTDQQEARTPDDAPALFVP